MLICELADTDTQAERLSEAHTVSNAKLDDVLFRARWPGRADFP